MRLSSSKLLSFTWLKPVFVLYICILALSACGKSETEKAQEDGPYEVAFAFFDALYNQKNLDQALKYTTPRTARIMQHYKTSKAVQRHILNMKYDEVNIVVNKDTRSGSVRLDSATKANVDVMFDGTYDGRVLRDMKTVEMVKQKGVWKVDEIKADPYAN
ncbi:hypothetical protein HR060_18725 [Catenovulum sp. SM1970]|uniref:hypothetical protein n=1 Tax=Marinifaba aquimaris TaxID=2741323 RepID=UPI001572B81C|nr:hypothetical protein [Marinifaba aquimaris]NTS78880.1 hypothetical protein [Marinifaba aquimaris]